VSFNKIPPSERATCRAATLVCLFLCGVAPMSAQGLVNVSAASYAPGPLAPESIVAAFGQKLATGTQAADPTRPLPTTLIGTSVLITDAAGAARPAPLYYVSASQVNYVIPAGTTPGSASVRITSGDSSVSTATIQIAPVAPAIFTANQSGKGPAAAQIYRIRSDGSARYEPVFACDSLGQCHTLPIDFGSGSDQLFLILYGTGIRGRTSLSGLKVSLGNTTLDVLYAGPQNQYPGMDQLNVPLPRTLNPNQVATISITADGAAANTTSILLSNGGIFPGAVIARFDPATPSTGPFPTDFLTVPDNMQKTGLRVNLPLPNCNVQPSTCSEINLLNQLDGFNLQSRIAVSFSGAVDPGSLRGGIFLLWLDEAVNDEKGQQPPGHLTAINQVVYDPATNTAYAKPDESLDQHRRYAILVTDSVQDSAGTPVAPDAAFQACLTGAPSNYCGRVAAAVNQGAALVAPRHIVAASAFTTLSVTAWMEDVRRQIQNVNPGFQRASPRSVFDAGRILTFTWREQVGNNPVAYNDVTIPLPAVVAPSVGRLAFGSYRSPRVLNSRQTISATPTAASSNVSTAATAEIYVHAYLPASAQPPSGYPVVIFGHGYSDSGFASPTLVAGSFASAGFATVAINAQGHGFGPESKVRIGELGANTEIPSGGRGLDVNGDNRIDDNEGCLIADPPVGLRDCMRQTVIDLIQLVHAIQLGIDLDGDGRPDLDRSRIYYAGISFGSMYGTMLTALEPGITAAALNVGGGPVVDIARWGRSFHSDARMFLAVRTPSLVNAGNDFNEDYVLRNQPAKVTTIPGAIDIQNFFERLEWLQVSGDQIGYAPHLRSSPLAGNMPKPVLWQFARGDQTVPNPTNSNLIRAAGQADSAVLYRHDLARPLASYLPDNPHTFLVNIIPPGGLAIAAAAQGQLSGFLSSNGTSIPDANSTALQVLFLGRKLFERPVQLPEDLGY